MPIVIVHRHVFEFPTWIRSWVTQNDLTELEAKIMSELSDAIAEATASADDAIVRVQDDVAALNTQIAELQAKVDAGVATPEDIAAIKALTAKTNALDPVKPQTLS